MNITQPAPFTVNVSTAQPICPGTKATFTASGGNTYQWLPTSLSGPVVTLSPSGTTSYTLSATNNAGCIAQKIFTLQVVKCTNITENSLDHLAIFYDSGVLTVNTDHTSNNCIEIFDLNGRPVYKNNIFQNLEVDISGLPGGFYLMKVSNEDSSVYRKIVIDK